MRVFLRCFFFCLLFDTTLLFSCAEPIDVLNNNESIQGEIEIDDNANNNDNDNDRDDPVSLGVRNALKKAAQMKNFKWKTTANGMPYNNGFFQANTIYTGIPYSSVLEYCQYVFLDVSLETFATAVYNPRSVLYTENVSAENSKSILGRKYVGSNCACYYGSTCSYLIVYALGLPFGILASEFPYYTEMEVVKDQSYSGVQLADVLSSGTHVVLVTGIKRDEDGEIQLITTTENAWITTSSASYTPEQFDNYLSTGYKILRYKHFEKNTNYTPYTSFVAVEDEILEGYKYNDDICPNYGNKSNYVEGETVIINVCSNYTDKGYTDLEVFRDDQRVCLIPINNEDIVLKDLGYGDYKVCLTNGTDKTSDFSYFKVVNMSVSIDSSTGSDVICFTSANATPLYYDLCNEIGHKGPSGVESILTHQFTKDELIAGKATLFSPLVLTEDYPYVKVHFETEYGRTTKTVRKEFIK